MSRGHSCLVATPTATCGRLRSVIRGGANTSAAVAKSRGADRCQLNFGNLDPKYYESRSEILSGWGVRPYNWRFGASVQHEISRGISIDAGYNRRTWGNFFVTYNELVGPADYDVYSVPVPNHPNLPNAGGSESFVSITPAASARGSRSFQTLERTAPARRARPIARR